MNQKIDKTLHSLRILSNAYIGEGRLNVDVMAMILHADMEYMGYDVTYEESEKIVETFYHTVDEMQEIWF